MNQTVLSIPQHRDPVARAALIACALALIWLAVTSAMPPAGASARPTPIILVATPTLPPAPAAPMLAAATPLPRPTEAPPAPTAAPIVVEAPPVVVVQPQPTEPPAAQRGPVGERRSDKQPPHAVKPPVMRPGR